MVILNTLLMQAGFSPALMDDPNKFDGYAIDELITLIHEGMERTRNLCDYVIQEHTTPTFPEAALLPLKLLGGESTMADLLDELDSKPTQHWMDVHPIQRKELNGYANLLAQSLQGKEHSSSPLLQNSLFSTPKLTALDEGDGLFVETHTKNRQV